MSRNPQVFHAPSEHLSREARKAFGTSYVPRVPKRGEALPARNSVWDRPAYVPTCWANTRAGSEAALAIKSKGLST